MFSKSREAVLGTMLIVFASSAHAAPILFDGVAMNANGTASINSSAAAQAFYGKPSVLLLTDALTSQTGSAYRNEVFAVNDKTSFSTRFQFDIRTPSNNGGSNDGLTFVLQNNAAGLSAIGGNGGGLGYFGITESIAIDISEFPNQHVGVTTNGSANSLTMTAAPFDLINRSSPSSAWIDYDGDLDLLEVFLSAGPIRPATPLISVTLDIAAILGAQTFVGFTAATGNPPGSQHVIVDWDFSLTTPTIGDPDPDPTPVSISEPSTLILMLVSLGLLIGFTHCQNRRNSVNVA